MNPKKLTIICILISLLTSVGVTGCTPYHLEKAPCDQYASFCGKKIKINHWQ